MVIKTRSFARCVLVLTLGLCLLNPTITIAQTNKGIAAPSGAMVVTPTNTAPAQQAPVAPAPPDPQSQTGTSAVAYPATFENVVKAALRLGAFDLNNDDVIDDFARVAYCEIYKAHYLNEFEWKRARVALREKIQQDLPTYPTTLFLDRTEEFTTYDFKTQRLQMDPRAILDGVTQLRLTPPEARAACGTHLTTMNQDFIVNLNQSININGIKLKEDEASAIVSGLTNDTENSVVKRHGYGRYFVTLTNTVIPPIEMKNIVLFRGNIDRITFYEDDTYQKPFWSGIDSVPDYHSMNDLQDTIQFKGVGESK